MLPVSRRSVVWQLTTAVGERWTSTVKLDLQGKPFEFQMPFGSYIMENVLLLTESRLVTILPTCVFEMWILP